ncbi:hypothetical protein RRG08_007179 [Elysia crispata]|uniref:Uncharacterized protein n=1 Tax=Elysia crispata TaxID=231223 RepID=A0AAE1B580_9GAST|nr:hypothetical protein RRG08_007179 [Elysia crispata]
MESCTKRSSKDENFETPTKLTFLGHAARTPRTTVGLALCVCSCTVLNVLSVSFDVARDIILVRYVSTDKNYLLWNTVMIFDHDLLNPFDP